MRRFIFILKLVFSFCFCNIAMGQVSENDTIILSGTNFEFQINPLINDSNLFGNNLDSISFLVDTNDLYDIAYGLDTQNNVLSGFLPQNYCGTRSIDYFV